MPTNKQNYKLDELALCFSFEYNSTGVTYVF